MSRHIAELIEARMSRREVLGGLSGTTALLTIGCVPKVPTHDPVDPFIELKAGLDGQAHWPKETHNCQVVISWGDPIFPRAPDWQPGQVRALHQAQQFGDGNDFIAYMPLERGSNNSNHGLLCVNHEFTSRISMFPDNPKPSYSWVAEAELMAHGHSIVEVLRTDGEWQIQRQSQYNRRLTPRTPMTITGPAAGHPRMKTSEDPTGAEVHGTIANCSGGVTPWHTVLSGEENIHLYFRGVPEDAGTEADNHRDMGVGVIQPWRFDVLHDRWILAKAPNEPNRFGWIVQIDPYDPHSKPTKHTALGRFAHEGAEVIVDPSGRIVVLMGDDTADQFVYRYVSDGVWDPNNPATAAELLDKGTLYVARFDDEGLDWLPLTLEGVLAEHFSTMGDLLIETRRAARLMEATPMDRPERVATHPNSGEIYVMLTKNPDRKSSGPASPKAKNLFGHILVMTPPDNDYLQSRWTWSFLLEGGPAGTERAFPPHELTTQNGMLSCPDNCCFDQAGRLYVTTDGATSAMRRAGMEPVSDGMFVVETEGPQRGRCRLFFRAPIGAELTGPCFTPDESTLFLSVQHPGKWPKDDGPDCHWPAADDSDLPPRASVVALTKQGGGKLI